MAIEIPKPDMSCYPFRRRKAYLAIVIPYLGVLSAAFLYLLFQGLRRGNASPGKVLRTLPALLFLSFYLGMCHFQAYCCACQECPYVGEFCPALAGIYPANLLASFRYGDGVGFSERRFKLNAGLAGACWGGIMVFPLYWIFRKNRYLAAGYLLAQGVYYVLHGLLLCPECAIRETCPGGALQGALSDKD